MLVATGTGGLNMMYAESSSASDVFVEQALGCGESDARYGGEIRNALL